MSAPAQRIEATASAVRQEAAPGRPLRTVTGYRLPGEGSSSRISVVTVVLLLALAFAGAAVFVQVRWPCCW